MARSPAKKSASAPAKKATSPRTPPAPKPYDNPEARDAKCSLPMVPPRIFGPGFDPRRAAAIIVSDKKWVNGTHLRYHFMQQPKVKADADVVRAAFRQWKDLPIGLQFTEVSDADEAEIRITFDRNDGSWSLVGRDALDSASTDATMNFGWQLSGWSYGRDTALHEIGHAMGLPHEHQNPNAGIQWDEAAVLAHFAAPPNEWDDETTRWNILRKIPPDSVQGSEWDCNSVMHYQFDAGLILVPEKYRTQALVPAGNLSQRDIQWAKTFYPAEPDEDRPTLTPFESKWFDLKPAQQVDFTVKVTSTRTYDFGTFGTSDTVLALFEEVTTGPEELRGLRFRAGDDDSGEDRNAHFRAKLFKGKKYVVRLRLYWAGATGRTAIMMW